VEAVFPAAPRLVQEGIDLPEGKDLLRLTEGIYLVLLLPAILLRQLPAIWLEAVVLDLQGLQKLPPIL